MVGDGEGRSHPIRTRTSTSTGTGDVGHGPATVLLAERVEDGRPAQQSTPSGRFFSRRLGSAIATCQSGGADLLLFDQTQPNAPPARLLLLLLLLGVGRYVAGHGIVGRRSHNDRYRLLLLMRWGGERTAARWRRRYGQTQR